MNEVFTFGQKIRRLREDKKIPLRELAGQLDIDPGNWSRIENDKLSPPSTSMFYSKLKKILGYGVQTECELQDLAEAGKFFRQLDLEVTPIASNFLKLFLRKIKGDNANSEDAASISNWLQGQQQ